MDGGFTVFEKYIIAFSPNAKSFSNLIPKYKWLANVTEANVIGFDYPNIGNSIGWVCSQDSLVLKNTAPI